MCLVSLRCLGAFVSRHLLGLVVPSPGVPGRREGGWSFSAPIPREGPRGLPLGVAGAAGFAGRDAARGARAAAVLRRLWSAGGGDPVGSGAGECGRGRGGERGPARAGVVPGPAPPERPPRGRLCVLFPLVPGAVTPISVRGDLREPGGEGRGAEGGAGGARRRAGEPRAPGSGGPGPRLRAPLRPAAARRGGPQSPRSERGPGSRGFTGRSETESRRLGDGLSLPVPWSRSNCPVAATEPLVHAPVARGASWRKWQEDAGKCGVRVVGQLCERCVGWRGPGVRRDGGKAVPGGGAGPPARGGHRGGGLPRAALVLPAPRGRSETSAEADPLPPNRCKGPALPRGLIRALQPDWCSDEAG